MTPFESLTTIHWWFGFMTALALRRGRVAEITLSFTKTLARVAGQKSQTDSKPTDGNGQ